MAPVNRLHVNVAKPMITKNSSGACALGSPAARLTVRAIGTKDRHSKVRTAKGLRDRRVRLSAPTAIQFFEVQDRLGFDQPSKALDWLIRKARAAIDKLAPVELLVGHDDGGKGSGALMENMSQKINIGEGVDEQHIVTAPVVNVGERQSSDFHAGSKSARRGARNRAQDKAGENSESDEVLPTMAAPFTPFTMSYAPESFILSESKQLCIQPLPFAHHHHRPLEQSSSITLPQPTIPHPVHLPTYAFHTTSEFSSPLIFHDLPLEQLPFSSPPAALHPTKASYCISPRGTLQSIFTDSSSSSHSQSVPTMELYGLMMGLQHNATTELYDRVVYNLSSGHMIQDAALPL